MVDVDFVKVPAAKRFVRVIVVRTIRFQMNYKQTLPIALTRAPMSRCGAIGYCYWVTPVVLCGL